ncbi:S8 family serine peptidase [Mycoplasma procyoni]|uniref:S8 family serine peptidase n=1 Tax=Mycoplasma procyoni TaxID=568784 RepID=UPI00197B15B3|nr:S8 family serine peptidase [Mycoplasma procyoni]MBN3534919.1 S8 family serine peptidase [Mycoplasma procyoni]
MKLELLNGLVLGVNALSPTTQAVQHVEEKKNVTFSFELKNFKFSDENAKYKFIQEFTSSYQNEAVNFFASKYTDFIFLRFSNLNKEDRDNVLQKIKNYFKVSEIFTNLEDIRDERNSKKIITPYLDTENKTSNADVFNVMNFRQNERKEVLETLNKKRLNGQRVKVGILDDGKIEYTDKYFSKEEGVHKIENKSRFWWFNNNYGTHATQVAAVVGGKDGINPYSHLYGIRAFTWNGPEQEIEWLISNDVKVINLSYYLDRSTSYNGVSRYLDLLSTNTKKEVTFVIASGNLENDSFDDLYKKGLQGDGLSYNSILVGAIWNNDHIKEFSSWRSKTGKKVNVVAPDNFKYGDETFNGTSYSSPAVAGIISVLMELESDTYAKGLDSVITMSALTSSSNPNIWTLNSNKNYELTKNSIHDQYGPGKIDFQKMREALQNTEYKIINKGNSSDKITFKKVFLNKGEKISVGLAWNYDLKTKDGEPKVHDFDLSISGPNGFHTSSTMVKNNYERSVFTAPETGEYILKLNPYEKLEESDVFHVAMSYVRF